MHDGRRLCKADRFGKHYALRGSDFCLHHGGRASPVFEDGSHESQKEVAMTVINMVSSILIREVRDNELAGRLSIELGRIVEKINVEV